mmetsp:Transcript_34464/g.68020  ORF Transcript_34464/g.68020 Transcript_34464/m.68020 type:complete len:835 (+) Transcript_34464:108-2612(+)
MRQQWLLSAVNTVVTTAATGPASGQTIVAFRGSQRFTSCAVSDMDKIMCGFPGIDASQCKELGCCFAPLHNPSWHQCFQSKEKEAESCSLTPGQVSDCGKYDVLQDPLGLACKSQGCCFLANGPRGSAMCFRKRYPQTVALATPSCRVPEATRRACSSQEATRSQCLDRGCCYDKVHTQGSHAASCYFAELSATPLGAAAAVEPAGSAAGGEEAPTAGLGAARSVTNGTTKLTVAATTKPTTGLTSTSVARVEGSPAKLFPTTLIDETNGTFAGRQGEDAWISGIKNTRTTVVSMSSAQAATAVQASGFVTSMVTGTTVEISESMVAASRSRINTATTTMETTASFKIDAVKQDVPDVRTTREATANESGTSVHTGGVEWRPNLDAQSNGTTSVVPVAAATSTAGASVPSAKTALATSALTAAAVDMTITTARGTTNGKRVFGSTTMMTATFTSTAMTPTAAAAFMPSQTTKRASAMTAATTTTIAKTPVTTRTTITARATTTSTQILPASSKTPSIDTVVGIATTTTAPHTLVPSNDAAAIPSILHDRHDGQLFRSLSVFASLTAVAISTMVAVFLMMCFFRSTPAEETCNHSDVQDPMQDKLHYSYNSVPQGAESSKCTRLQPQSELYKELQRQFIMRWDTTLWMEGENDGKSIPPPTIREVWEVHAETHLQLYMAKQIELEEQPGHKHGYNPGNEKSRYHGARLKCPFRGVPCQDAQCTVCRIIEDGNFSNSKHQQEIRFTLASHAAKGCCLAPDKEPPPRNLSDFLDRGAGNAIFVASVLLGTPHVVTSKQSGPLPPGTHSRVADKKCGVDELVIFDTAQAIPRALIIFR